MNFMTETGSTVILNCIHYMPTTPRDSLRFPYIHSMPSLSKNADL